MTGDGRRVTSGRSIPTGQEENRTIFSMRTALTFLTSSGTTPSVALRTISSSPYMPCVRHINKPVSFRVREVYTFLYRKIESFIGQKIINE